MRFSLANTARALGLITTLGFFVWQGNVAWAAADSCKRHGPVASDCAYCLDGEMHEGIGTAFTFRWTNQSGRDIVIRQSGSLKLQVEPGQPGAQVGFSSDFGGSYAESVLWFSLPGHGSVNVVFDGTQPDLLTTHGAFLLTSLLPGFDAALPAVVLKVSAEQAEYDFGTRQVGTFRSRTQCAVFYRAASR